MQLESIEFSGVRNCFSLTPDCWDTSSYFGHVLCLECVYKKGSICTMPLANCTTASHSKTSYYKLQGL